MHFQRFCISTSWILYFSLALSNAEQFDHWYSFYSNTLLHRAGPKCYPNYTAGAFPEYHKYFRKYLGKDKDVDRCKSMATCLLENIDDFDKADMQSATIILGLMPTILAYVGPTVGEMALISSRRPVLAVFLALGAPAIFATRPFDFNDPRNYLKRDVGTFTLSRQTSVRAAMMTAAQYLVLSLAVINSLLNSVQLGTSTILSWKCLWPYLQLSWNLMPLVPHFCAALSIRYSKIHRPPNLKGSLGGSPSVTLIEHLWNELNPLSNHAKPDFDIGIPEGKTAVCLNWAAVMLGYAHWIYGTLVFSSILFIGTLDGLGVIARYLASALLCRAILLVELAGLK